MSTNIKQLVLCALFGLAAAACGDDNAFQPGDRRQVDPDEEDYVCSENGERQYEVGLYCCDPDAMTACSCPDYWVCTAECGGNGGNGKVCDQPFPDAPGGDIEWGECVEQEGLVICTGDADTFPEDGEANGWDCETQGEFVVCERGSTYPDGGDGNGWICEYNEAVRTCEYQDDGEWVCTTLADGSTECVKQQGVGPDGGDWDCFFDNGSSAEGDDALICDGHSEDGPDDGSEGGYDCFTEVDLYERCRDETPEYPDEGGDVAWNCWIDEFAAMHCTDGEVGPPDGGDLEACPFGDVLFRWCDGPTYCSWGKQLCQLDNTWGPCLEEEDMFPEQPGMQIDRPNNSCACRHFYFDPDCCERDDCMVMAADNHEPPTCESDGGLCGYCNNDDDCSAGGICLEDGHGATLCGQPCSAPEGGGAYAQGDCPDDFFCAPIRDYYGNVVASQCAPAQANGCDI